MDVCNKFDEDIHEATERNEASTICDTFMDDNFIHTGWRILCFRSFHPFEPFLHNAHHPTSEKKSSHTTLRGGAAASSKKPFFSPARTAEWRFFAPDFPLHLNWQEALLPSVKKSRSCHTQHSTSLTKKGAIVCFFLPRPEQGRYSYVLIKFSAPCARYVRLSIWENAFSSYLVNNVKDDSEISPAYATRLPFLSLIFFRSPSFTGGENK